jgi:hypothetical protein
VRNVVFASLTCVLACADITAQIEPPRDERVMVIYQGAPQRNYRPAYQPDSIVRYLVGFENGRPRARITTAVILAEIYAPSGRVLASWACRQMGAPCARKADWYAWLDTTIVFLRKLDAAAAQADAWFGPQVIGVAPALLYPDGARVKDVKEYADSLEARFARARFPHLELRAYYWLHETVGGPERDSLIIPMVSDMAHARGRELWWIPYWGSPASARWRSYGFDRAWIQPNHYFNLEVPDSRLPQSASAARWIGSGMEIEFSGQGPYTRLDPYLESASGVGSLAIYEGGGALLRLEQRDPVRYRKLINILSGESLPD